MIEVQSFESKVYKQHSVLKINSFCAGYCEKVFEVNCGAFSNGIGVCPNSKVVQSDLPQKDNEERSISILSFETEKIK